MRNAMINEVSSFVAENQKAVLLLADTGSYAFRRIKNEYPDRVIDIGIMEDGMMGMAAGMALAGMIPTVYAMTPFIVERALEQIKLDFLYQKLAGNIITLGSAYDFSMLGYSHYCPEDFGVLKNLPGIQFIAPGSASEMASLYSQCCNNLTLTYFRLSDYPNKQDIDVEFGKAYVIKRGSKATVIAVGTILDVVMNALIDEDVTILYYTTLSPFDGETLRREARNEKILICEPELMGCLDAEIVRSFAGQPVVIEHVGLPIEIYRNYGKKAEKDAFYGITSENVLLKYNRLIGR